MTTFKTLQSCNKKPEESWEKFAARHNKIVDELNAELPDNLLKYSHVTVVSIPVQINQPSKLK